MKYLIKTCIKRLFFKCGYFVPKKILSPNSFLLGIRHKPKVVQFYELKALANLVGQINEQEYYNKLLKSLVPSYELNDIVFSKFIGEGAGKLIFNSYRFLDLKGVSIFEKVYYSDADKTHAIIWFYENYASKVTQYYKVPLLQSCFKGDLISIFHYQFLDLKLKKTNENCLINVSKNLYTLSAENKNLDFSTLVFPKGYRLHNAYIGYIEYVKKKLREHGLSITKIEKFIDSTEFVFSHGDLHSDNLFADNVIIDWDFFGFYPIGFEVAQIYSQMLFKGQKEEDQSPLEWFELHYKDFFNSRYQQSYINFIYFLYVFSHNLFNQEKNIKLEKALLDEIKRLQVEEVK